MAAVYDHDDAGSISSVPASSIGDDIDEDDMPQPSSAAPPVPGSGPTLPAKEREARVELSRSRQRSQQSAPDQALPFSTPISHPPSQSVSSAAANDDDDDPDDVPPPTYAEAVRRPASRPDDAAREAWRQNIFQGSLNIDSFTRLTSPTHETSTSPQQVTQPVAGRGENQNPVHHPTSPQSPTDERSPIIANADMTANYGSAAFSYRDEPENMSGGHNDPSSRAQGSPSPPHWWQQHPTDNGAASFQPGDHRVPAWFVAIKKSRRQRLKMFLYWLLVLVVFSSIVGLLMDVLVFSNNDQDDSAQPKQPQPNVPNIPLPGDPDRYRQSICPHAQWTDQSAYAFESTDDLKVVEALTKYDVDGSIRIVAAKPEQKHMAVVYVAYAIDPQYTIDNVRMTSYTDGVILDEPYITPDPYNGHSMPCIDVDIVVTIRGDALINNLRLDTTHLTIRTNFAAFNNGAGQGLVIRNSTTLVTTAGRVLPEYLNSRHVVIRTVSGSVVGDFALYDLLDIETKSGSVSVVVGPKAAEKDKLAEPARLRIETVSGSVDVNADYTPTGIANRDYQAHLETVSASIRGNYLLGSSMMLHTRSGTIDMTLVPFLFSSPSLTPAPAVSLRSVDGRDHSRSFSASTVSSVFNQRLDVKSISSSVDLDILAAYGASSAESVFVSNYATTSGTLRLKYPGEWSGIVEAKTISGSLDVEGSRLKRISGSWSWGDRSRDIDTEISSVPVKSDEGSKAKSTGLFHEQGKWRRDDVEGNTAKNEIHAATVSSSVHVYFQDSSASMTSK